MCGIAGLWDLHKNPTNTASVVTKITDSMQYRGPDSSGIWTSKTLDLSIGHRRLAIQDISSSGHQPMLSQKGQYVIVFNGEIYNFKEILEQLGDLESPLNGHSDTEVLLLAFEKWGVEDTLQKLEGMFAIALFDQVNQQLWLIRDRMGEKPLYYQLLDNKLFFASELSALSCAFDKPDEINDNGLQSYFRYGYFEPIDTPFFSVKKLAPASYLKLSKQQLIETGSTADLSKQINAYWRISDSVSKKTYLKVFTTTKAQISVNKFENLLQETVKKQSIADVKVGVFLSGGIDSSLVASALQNTSSSTINTYTIAFDDPKYNEAKFAEKIANHIGSNHTEISLSIDESIETLKLLPELLDEPFADASILPTYLVTREARKHVTVCLSGDGGDELFAGYNRYLSGDKFQKRVSKLPNFIRSASSRIIKSLSIKNLERLYTPISLLSAIKGQVAEKDIGIKLHKIAQLLPLNNADEMYVDLMSFWHKSPLINANDLSWGYYDSALEFPLNKEQFITHAMLNDQQFYLPCDNLFKVDRAAMFNSLEVRLPLLNHKIVEFANSLPLAYKVRNHQSKWIMRELLYRWVPKELIDRPKMGFSIPLNQWLRNELFTWANRFIHDKALHDLANLDSNKLKIIWNQHQKQQRDHSNAIWTVICYLIWFKQNQNIIK